MKAKPSILLLACCSLLIGLVTGVALTEGVLRLTVPNSYYIWPPNLKRTFTPDPKLMPGITGASRFEVNSLGFRGSELTPAHGYRILTIGGSTTECLYLDQAEAWPALLERALNESVPGRTAWVGNAGMSGRTSRHHLIAMKYLPLKEMKIDMIILLAGVNDFQIRLSRAERYDPDFLSKANGAAAVLSETFTGGLGHPAPDDPFFKRTVIWQLLRTAKHRLLRNRIQPNQQDSSGLIYETWRKHRREASEIRSALPDLSTGLAEYARNINGVLDIAQENSIRVLMMIQPTMWGAESEELKSFMWMGGVGEFQFESGKPYYSFDALQGGIEQYNAALLGICRLRGIECVDLSALPKDTTVFYDDVHFNEEGSRRVAEILARRVVASVAGANSQKR